MRKRFLLSVAPVAAALASACLQPTPTPSSAPTHIRRTIPPSALTGTERSGGRTPSTDSQVNAFLDVLALHTGRMTKSGVVDSTLGAAPFIIAAYDTSSTGKLIPVVIAARPKLLSPKSAHDDTRPIVFVEAGASADAADGTDAVLELLRSLLTEDASTHDHIPNVLDSLVLVVVPRARPSDVGAAIPAPDTDLVLAAARETQTTLALFHTWHPDVVIDLQSGDLGGAAYPTVVAPPLTPAALLAGPFTSDTLLRMLPRFIVSVGQFSVDTGVVQPNPRRAPSVFPLSPFACGTIMPGYVPGSDDTTTHVWARCDHRMRQLTNYAGLRNRVGIAIRANAALPLTRRVAALALALRATLSLIAHQRDDIVAHSAAADSAVEAWGADPGSSPGIPLRAAPPTLGPLTQILVTDDTARRAGPHPVLMAAQDPPTGAIARRPPLGYVLPPDDSATAHLLIRHGILVQRHAGTQRVMIVERFIIDSLTPPPVHFTGHWLRVIADTTLPSGSYIVPAGQALDLLTMQLLEPEGDDGLAASHVYDKDLRKGGYYPVVRLLD